MGRRIYAIGDIHGRLDLLDRLLVRIGTDAAKQAAAGRPDLRKVVVFLGDLIDRGADSRGVVERLRNGPPDHPAWAGFEWKVLRGNHESAMLDFLIDPAAGPMWLQNGGLATVTSYVGRLPDPVPGPEWLIRLRKTLAEAVPATHRQFLAGLPLSHEEGDYLFVHAGVRPGVPLDRQEASDLMWIRGDFLNSKSDHGRVVVHGHTVTREPEIRDNRIGIDTGAFATGRLTALVLDGTSRGFLST